MRLFSKLIVALLGVMTFSGSLVIADDADLYMVNPAISSQRPNILVVLDNTSNWANYFANEKSALVSLLSSDVINDQFNLGFMFFNNPNNKDGYSNAQSGVVVSAIRQMTATNKAKLADLFGNIDKNSDQGNSAPTVAAAMAEAWRYFSNQTAMDGGVNDTQRDYSGNTGTAKSYFNAVHALSGNAFSSASSRQYISPVVDICQRNFIIFISNGTPSSSEKNDPVDLASQSGGALPTEIALTSSFFQTNWADEWTRFMANHTLPNKPHVTTYTVSVDAANWTSHPADAVAWLTSMAKEGGGEYYGVSNNAQALIDALSNIFQKILAVNSVFAAVTLPVNVNVRGQYLNQIYMGVFRPDAAASPRWPGNLKLYKIQVDSNGNPELVDRNSNAVHDTVNGFITPTATSFWTTQTTNITQLVSPGVYQYGAYKFWDASYYPDAQGSGSPPKGTRDGVSDAPDGEMVEKGGAAQRLRDTYSYNYTSSTARINNRNVYTCTGSSCVSGALLSTMPFKSSNSDLTTTAFGLGGTATISSLTRTGSTCSSASCVSTVTAVTTTPHGFASNSSVTISGSDTANAAFYGQATITVVDATTFTYSIVESPSPVATGTITAVAAAGSPVTVTGVSYVDAGTTRTVTITAPGHGITPGTTVSATISDPNSQMNSAYSGSKTVTATNANQVTYTLTTSTVESPASGSVSYTSPYPSLSFYNNSTCTGASAGSVAIGTSLRNPGSYTLTLTPPSNSNKTPNATYSYVLVPSAIAGYAGCYACSSSDTTNCKKNSSSAINLTLPNGSVTTSTSPVAPPSTPSGVTVSTTSITPTVSALSRSGSTCDSGTNVCSATVTVTVNSSTGLAGRSVTINNANPTAYNGTYVVAAPTATTITYSISSSDGKIAPSRQTTGGTASSTTTGTTLADLLNWVRGQNVKGEDNPSELTSDVRGYLHGDVLHSRPAIINYNRTGEDSTRDIVIYYGANDGILHAVKGGREDGDGAELWGFIAPEHFSQFQRMYANTPLWSPTAPRSYFFDGPVSTLTKGTTDASGVIRIEGSGAVAQIFAGMRRGGRVYYSFNVLDPSAPRFKWKITGGSGDFTELGYTWSEAKVAKIKLGTADKDVLIFGGGYDPVANDASPQGTATMGRAIFVVDADSGSLIWQVGPTDAASLKKTDMVCSIPADVALLDANNDSYIDRIYAVDTCGNVWRANISDTNTANWSVGKIFSLAGSGVNARKFLFPPSIVREETYDVLLLGSGDREHPFDLTTVDRFYALRDYKALNDLGGTTVADSDLCDFTAIGDSQTCNCNWTEKLNAADGWTNSLTTRRGWKISFDSCPGEKVVGGAVTIAGTTVFGTNVPSASSCLTSSGQCSSGLGEARMYALGYQCGLPFRDANVNGIIEAADRYTKSPGGGFLPTGTPISVTDDNGKPVPPTVCLGPDCIKVSNPPSSRRHRVYWQMGIDNQ